MRRFKMEEREYEAKKQKKSLDSPPQNLIITLLLLSLIWI